MRYLELKYKGNTYTSEREINDILETNGFNWLIDSEVRNAKIEIKKETLIWHDGAFLSGDWYYGIFKNGEFYGNWESGIFEMGLMDGKWNDGINLSSYLS